MCAQLTAEIMTSTLVSNSIISPGHRAHQQSSVDTLGWPDQELPVEDIWVYNPLRRKRIETDE